MFYRCIVIIFALSFAISSSLLASCDEWTERGIETLAFMETKNYFNNLLDFKGTSEIVWRGEVEGLKSYVIKVRYLSKIPNGDTTQGCELIAYILLKKGPIGECIRYNAVTSPMNCKAYKTLTGSKDVISSFARLNMLGEKIEK